MAAQLTEADVRELQMRGDELADDAIKVIFEEHAIDGVDQLMSSLIRNDEVLSKDLPKLSTKAGNALSDYFGGSTNLPEWADRSLIEEGEKLYVEYGMMGFSILGCASLPSAYATGHAAKVLDATQQLETHIERRLYETTQFTIDVLSPGGLKPNGRGIRTTQKVRLMHAAIRKLILFPSPPPAVPNQQPLTLGEAYKMMRWPEQVLGTPLCQLAQGMAVLSFSFIVLRSLNKLGVTLRREQETAYLHCWNVVGFIMGVDQKLLLSPREETMAEAEYLYQRVWPRAIIETNEGKRLEEALLHYMESFLPEFTPPLRQLPRIVTRYLLDDQICDALGIRLNWQESIVFRALQGLGQLHNVGRGVADTLDVSFELANRVSSGLVVAFTHLPHLSGQSMSQLSPARIAAEFVFRRMAQGLRNRDRGINRQSFAIPTELAKSDWRLDQ